jgi:biotin carboxyl carrier protein
MEYVTTIGDQEFHVEVLDKRHIRVNGKVMEIDFESISGQPVYSLLIDGKSYEAFVSPDEDQWEVLLLGRQYPVRVEDARERRLRAAAGGAPEGHGDYQLKAPMPGLVVAVPVEENQQVEKGQVLLILESMKMQNELRAPRAGRVQRIKVKAGESVERRQVLLTVA